MINITSVIDLKLFIKRSESGNPVRDWYDDSDLIPALEELAKLQLKELESKGDEKLELEYLRYFYGECDFGPAHDDVVSIINDEFTKALPEGY